MEGTRFFVGGEDSLLRVFLSLRYNKIYTFGGEVYARARSRYVSFDAR